MVFSNAMMMGGSFLANGISYYNGGSGNNYLSTAGLSGASNSYTGSMSLWVKWGSDGVDYGIAGFRGRGIQIIRTVSNDLQVYLWNNAGGQVLELASSSGQATGANVWHNILASWSTNFSAGNKIGRLYLDGVNINDSQADGGAASQIAWSGVTEYLPSFSSPYNTNQNLALSEIWLSTASYIDFSNSANRALFYNSGHPVDLGSNGSTPTGSSPDVFLNQPSALAGNNQGTGGNFTIHGTLTDVTPPS
jgi:hypothetical protein